MAVLIVLLNVLLLAAGQVLWKLALLRRPLTAPSQLVPVLMQPAMMLGCFLFALATVIWFYALSRYALSRVYPLQSMAYVIGACSGIVLFKESFSSTQWLGLLFVVGGAFLLARA
ncbi:EamA family transporter [Paenibacillus sp. MBLB4367]|uniref:EamA family transporter n=1 Tax=Paenibacillus sp. MBLB4367 TaxID=3384767 RepID=UPI003907FDC6